ncbi:MAG: PQQ-binding-like beta-propeller repeat protein [Planctomycetota bacterium]
MRDATRRWRLSLFLTMAGLLGCEAGGVEEIRVVNPVAGAAVAEDLTTEDDWPCWRGPLRNGIAQGSAPVVWGPDENVLWRVEAPGRGHASPIVVGDLVIISSADVPAGQQLLAAYDRKIGAEAWRLVIHDGGLPSRRDVHQKATDANGTVACDGRRAYVAHLNGGQIVASAVDLEGGLVWQTELGPFDSKFGYAPSPVLHGPYVIFAADNWGGGYLAAVDRESGEIAWRTKRARTSTYSSPVVAEVAGRDQLLISGDDKIASYDPLSGEPLWSTRGVSEATCGTMVWSGDVVFASGGYPDRETIAVRADGSGETVWSNRVKVYEPSLLLAGPRLYGATDEGILYCWDASTGDQLWRKRVGGGFSASPVLCDGRVYIPNTSGETLVFEDTPDEYRELARNRLGDDAYASPAICGGRIYLRVGERQGGGRQEYLCCIATPSDETTADEPR